MFNANHVYGIQMTQWEIELGNGVLWQIHKQKQQLMSIGTKYKNNTHWAILIVLELEGKAACKEGQIQAVSLKRRLLPKKKVKRNQIFFYNLLKT